MNGWILIDITIRNYIKFYSYFYGTRRLDVGDTNKIVCEKFCGLNWMVAVYMFINTSAFNKYDYRSNIIRGEKQSKKLLSLLFIAIVFKIEFEYKSILILLLVWNIEKVSILLNGC